MMPSDLSCDHPAQTRSWRPRRTRRHGWRRRRAARRLRPRGAGGLAPGTRRPSPIRRRSAERRRTQPACAVAEARSDPPRPPNARRAPPPTPGKVRNAVRPRGRPHSDAAVGQNAAFDATTHRFREGRTEPPCDNASMRRIQARPNRFRFAVRQAFHAPRRAASLATAGRNHRGFGSAAASSSRRRRDAASVAPTAVFFISMLALGVVSGIGEKE